MESGIPGQPPGKTGPQMAQIFANNTGQEARSGEWIPGSRHHEPRRAGLISSSVDIAPHVHRSQGVTFMETRNGAAEALVAAIKSSVVTSSSGCGFVQLC